MQTSSTVITRATLLKKISLNDKCNNTYTATQTEYSLNLEIIYPLSTENALRLKKSRFK